MKPVFTLLTSLLMAFPAMAQYGHGFPSGRCAFNSDPARLYEPANIAAARKELKRAEDRLEDLEREYEEALEECEDCSSTVSKVLRLAVGKDKVQDYMDHLSGGLNCIGQLTSKIEQYNYLAELNGWEKMKITPDLSNYNPQRAVAGVNQVVDIPPPGEFSGGGTGTVTIDQPVIDPTPVPTFNNCIYAGANYTVKEAICVRVDRVLTQYEKRLCRSCLGVQNKYGNCLMKTQNLKQQIADQERKINRLDRNLDRALANPSGRDTCVDCIADNRNTFQKILPWALMGGVGLAYNWFAKRERKAYQQNYNQQMDYYKQVHEDNNKKGYYSPMPKMQNLSSAIYTSRMVGGIPIILATGAATGAFGCAGQAALGGILAAGGPLMGSLIGGAGGLQGNGGLNGQLTLNGGITTGGSAGGGLGGLLASLGGGGGLGGQGNAGIGVNGQWGLNGGGSGNGVAGGSGSLAGMTPAQIQANIDYNNRLLMAAQQRQQAYSSYLAWQKNNEAIRQKAEAEYRANGQNPLLGLSGQGNTSFGVNNQWGVGTSGLGNVGGQGVFQAGVNLNGNIGLQAGSQFGSQLQVGGNQSPFAPGQQPVMCVRAPCNPNGFNPNPQVAPQQVTPGGSPLGL